MTQFSDDQIIAQYLGLRDKLKAYDDQAKEGRKTFTDAMDLLEGVMSSRLLERGAQNSKTAAGTAYRSRIVKYKVSDQASLLAFAKVSEAWNLVSLQTVKDEVDAYVEANGKVLPPGVDATMIEQTNFRKA